MVYIKKYESFSKIEWNFSKLEEYLSNLELYRSRDLLDKNGKCIGEVSRRSGNLFTYIDYFIDYLPEQFEIWRDHKYNTQNCEILRKKVSEIVSSQIPKVTDVIFEDVGVLIKGRDF